MIDQKTLSTRAWIELAILSVIWGGSFLSIRIALDEIPFVTSVAYRVGLAAIALWCVVLWRGDWRGLRGAHVIGFAGMGVLNNVIPFCLMAWGQLHIESGLTSILNASTAIFGVVAAALFFADERLSLRKAVGVTLGFFGVATAIGLSNLTTLDVRSLAQLAVVAGTVSYALAGVWARKRLTALPPTLAAAGMLTASTVIMVPAAVWIDGIVVPQQDDTWIAIGYYALIATALAYMLYYRVLAMAGSGNLMLCTLLVAPVAITLGAIVRHEALPTQAFVGFTLLALGLMILDGRILRRWARRPSKEA